MRLKDHLLQNSLSWMKYLSKKEKKDFLNSVLGRLIKKDFFNDDCVSIVEQAEQKLKQAKAEEERVKLESETMKKKEREDRRRVRSSLSLPIIADIPSFCSR